MKIVNGVLKKNKPNFIRHDINKKIRIKKTWNKPKGLHNKLRLGRKGYGKSVNVGYGSPAVIRGFHYSGVMPINVSSLTALDSLDAKTQGVIISKSVGQKKKIEIVAKAKELGLRVLNVKDVDAYLEKVKKIRDDKRKIKTDKTKLKEEKKKEAEKTVKKKEELSDEEKKKAEKKEKEKVLVTKQ